MSRTLHFSVSPRLAALLGETYRSTEAALKELVDNAWDADARNIWVTLPEPMTSDPIIIADDGDGMTPNLIETEYLDIARNRRSLKGKTSQRMKRRIKGRKGIGKFAGLAAARNMLLETVRDGTRSTVTIDKQVIMNAPDDLERIPLSLVDEPAKEAKSGTTITLSDLDQALNFPSAEELRALLLYEYGRETTIDIFVNDRKLDIEDLPGKTMDSVKKLTNAGDVKLRFTIADGRMPKHAGFVLRVGGKVVGRPKWFGLDETPDIPEKLRKRVYGEINVEGIEDVVTSDWGAIIENSKAHDEISDFVRTETTKVLKKTYNREMNLQQARLKQEISRRIEKLPEHRREFAELALGKILVKFYGERENRVDTVASVVLDAMERDEYWQVFQNIDKARNGDVVNFAEALEQFGLVEMTLMGERARGRLQYLSDLDNLAAKTETLEAQMHTAMEHSLWVLGAPFHLMSSNETLGRIVQEYGSKKFKGKNKAKRPDLLLNTDPGDRYLLIEFKRPSHPISRQDEAQAQGYADDLRHLLPAKPFDIILIGGKRASAANPQNDPPNMKVHSYADIISHARHEVEWLLKSSIL